MTSTASSELDARLEFAVKVARQAGEQTLRLFRSADLEAERKADGSPVTRADRDAEALLRRLIAERFPDDAILGEEFGETRGQTGFRWILDPIDGTKAFLAGVPLYATLVAVLEVDSPRILADQPPKPSRVSAVSEIATAVCVTSSVKSFTTERKADAREVYDRLQSACRVTRTWGDAYGYLLVATGRAEIAIDPAMNLWDTAPLQPIIEAAGGKFFDWQGEPTVHRGEAVAANAALAEQVLEFTRSVPS